MACREQNARRINTFDPWFLLTTSMNRCFYSDLKQTKLLRLSQQNFKVSPLGSNSDQKLHLEKGGCVLIQYISCQVNPVAAVKVLKRLFKE